MLRKSIAPAKPTNGPTSRGKRGIEPSPGRARHRRRTEHFARLRWASGVARRPSSRCAKVFVLQMSSASGWLGAAACAARARAAATAGVIDDLLEAHPNRHRGALEVLEPHVRIAHQDHRVAAAGPRECLEAVFVVVVVRALSLRDVAPRTGDVTGREAVLQEVKREPSSASIARASAWRSAGASCSLARRVAFCSALRWNQA
jgi:hypothetical protein